MVAECRNLEEFNGKHEGQAAFILAPGPSLSLISVIKPALHSFVTISVNSAYAMSETDYFVSDDSEVAVWSYFAHDLRNSPNTTVFLYEDKLKNTVPWFGDRAVLFRHRLGYNITNTYEHENSINKIVQCRTSLASAIHIAHIMGCSPIIVLGLDCVRVNGLRWFWQFDSWKRKPQRLDGRKADKYNHIRSSGDSDLSSILHYWKTQGKEINKTCEVYNASDISKVDVFPYVDLNTIVECI